MNNFEKQQEISKTKSGNSQLKGILIVLFASALFSSLGTLTNFAYEAGISPVAFATWRETIGAITMVVLLVFGIGRPAHTERTPLSQIPKWQLRNLCLAAIMFMSYSLAIFYAFVHLTVALALLLFYIYPALVTVICAITGRESFTRPKFIALLLALGGSTLAILGQMLGGDAVRFDSLGIILALGAAVGMSIYFLVGRNGYPSIPASYATTLFLTAGAVVFAVIGFVFGEKESLIQPLHDASLWPILLFAGVVGAAIPTMMLLTGIRMIGASRASILAIFEPISGAIVASMFLGQNLYFNQIIGGVLILSAAVILQRNIEPKVERSVELPVDDLLNPIGK
ncbi:DMT family transporter [Neobacillus drentensis]|uniref:DMT family transporter n=1 Tax=Neobacillus drentensis TaxID=220684 RepID=UPI0030033BD1